MTDLTKTNAILSDPRYQDYLSKIADHEKNRRFCRHDLSHFIDVARITTILCLEAGLKIDRDLIYTTALLHDIGRFREYEDGTPHELASAELAVAFLGEYSAEEQETILDAIRSHRNPNAAGFTGLFYRADKLSRPCYNCPAEAECNWAAAKKNLEITY